jgi:PAS domain S-box-containing protein
MRGDRRRALIVLIAALVFAGVFALRLSSDDPSETIGVLFVIPIALMAFAFGIPGAVAVAGLSFGAVIVWDVTQDVGLDAPDYLLRAAAFLTMALTIGVISAGPRSARIAQRQMIESAPDALLAVNAEGEIELANARAEQLFGHSREEMVGKPIEALVSSDTGEGRGFIVDFLSDPKSASLESPLELCGRNRLGHEFPCEISLSALETRTGTLALVAIRDVTERKRAEEELRRAVRRLEASTEIAHAIGGETELETILDEIVDRGRSLIEASGLVVMLADGDGLIVAATAGNVDERIRGMHVDLAGLTGAAVRTLRPQRIDRMKEISAVPGKERRAPGHASAAVVVPLEFRGSALGVVVAFDRRDGPAFTDEDERMLLSFAASAATAVATARDVAEDRLRRAIEAAEQERKRWARELHDETLQGLGALRVALASALRAASTEGLEEVVATAVDEIAEEIRSLRSLIAELRPAALDELGLAAAIETLSERSASLVGLEMDTRVDLGTGRPEDGDSRLDPELESTIYRLVQESLSNISKHARAERVTLRVHESNGSIEVLIEDDGVGFDPETSDRGFGLVGMRERVAMVGGEMEIRSAPGQGVTLRARLPTSPAPRSSVGAQPSGGAGGA